MILLPSDPITKEEEQERRNRGPISTSFDPRIGPGCIFLLYLIIIIITTLIEKSN